MHTQELTYITVQCFDLAATKHALLDMPSISLLQCYMVIHPQDIISAVNLQHNCHYGACGTTGTQALYEEFVKHTDSEHYIVNTTSLHNYAHIASALPSHLQTSSFHVEKQKPPPDAAECDPTLSSIPIEVPLTLTGDGSTAPPHNRDEQPIANHEHEAPLSAPIFSHHPKDKPQKGKAKQSMQAIKLCTVDVLKYFCALYGLSKASNKADLVDCLMEDIQNLQHTYPTAQEIRMAQDVVKQQTEALANSCK
ncbi:hypothetical protein BJV74DRAFT_797145 [Russula compacta]|nr:hypothetical protein BJV74DRAFT_797145 [Russula compacta]